MIPGISYSNAKKFMFQFGIYRCVKSSKNTNSILSRSYNTNYNTFVFWFHDFIDNSNIEKEILSFFRETAFTWICQVKNTSFYRTPLVDAFADLYNDRASQQNFHLSITGNGYCIHGDPNSKSSFLLIEWIIQNLSWSRSSRQRCKSCS